MINERRVKALQGNLIFILKILRKLTHEKISLKDKWVDFHKLSKIIITHHFLILKGMQSNLMKSVYPSSLQTFLSALIFSSNLSFLTHQSI